MGTTLQEQAVPNSLNNLSYKDRANMKGSWNNGQVTKKGSKVNIHLQHGTARDSTIPATERLSQPRGRRAKPDRTSVTDTTTVCAQFNPKTKSQVSSTFGGKERRHKQNSQSNSDKDQNSVCPGKSRCTLSLPLTSLSEQRQDSSGGNAHNVNMVKLNKRGEEDSDSASDLSDSERLPVPRTPRAPPQLDLRPEVIDPSDFQPPVPGPRGQRRGGGSYPDFLPPPFNSWSLRQLAVFLNTEGKGAPRPRPVGQLEKYLERLLQLEWHQIQTFEEDNGTMAPLSTRCHRAHTTSPSNLSSPKSILQCQRAFPLTLLSSLTNSPTIPLPGCACTHCRSRYPFCNGTCRSYAYQRSSRLSPLLEHRGPASVLPKRSSSESRVPVSEQSLVARGRRVEVTALNGSSHLRRMQAVGNIRNPIQSLTVKPQPVSRNICAEASAAKRTGPLGGGKAPYRDVKDAGSRRRGGTERRRAMSVGRDAKPGVVKDDLPGPKDLAPARQNGKPKHVEFVT